jgi:hydroxyethylthiazole kinase-like uncharacterized protein yjeF
MKNVFKEVITLDKRCYEEYALSEDILMEHAANNLALTIKEKAKPKSDIFFLCGPGNNGADGIASARILHKQYDVHVCVPYGVKSKMARLQLKRFEKLGGVVTKGIIDSQVYVDALFGSGLSKKLDAKACEMIEELNKKDAIKISCDIPSGLGDDFISDKVFKADVSVSMGALKLSFFEDYAKEYIGEIKVADLGVSREIYEDISDIHLLEAKDMKLPLRDNPNTNKGVFGHTCIVGGAKGGAAILSATAAMNFGSGLVSILTNKDENIPPFIMSSDKIPKNCTSLVVGMGLGDKNFDLELLIKNQFGVVIDADLFYNPFIKKLLEKKQEIVLTPHPKEFSSLLEICDIAKADVKAIQLNRFKYVDMFAKKYPKTTLVLKGANTIISSHRQIYISTLGTNTLSKGGSGDVLSGMIGSLIAQGYDCKDAAITAVLAHSMSAKKLTCNNYALNPLDLCEGIKYL